MEHAVICTIRCLLAKPLSVLTTFLWREALCSALKKNEVSNISLLTTWESVHKMIKACWFVERAKSQGESGRRDLPGQMSVNKCQRKSNKPGITQSPAQHSPAAPNVRPRTSLQTLFCTGLVYLGISELQMSLLLLTQ